MFVVLQLPSMATQAVIDVVSFTFCFSRTAAPAPVLGQFGTFLVKIQIFKR